MDLPSDITLECVLLLESAFQADPEAIQSLIVNRVPCNMQLAEHAHVVVQSRVNEQQALDGYEVGMLGVINGILSQIGQKPVAMKYSDDSPGEEKLIGFTVFEPKTEATTDQLVSREATIRTSMKANAKLRDVAALHSRMLALCADRDDNYAACLAVASGVLDRMLIRAAAILEKLVNPRECDVLICAAATPEKFVNRRERLEAELAALRADNAAMLKQWNDLDTRTEQRHREWCEQLAERDAEIERLRHVIAEHELCHEDGEVTAECFAKSCIAYQVRKFGRSPTQEEIERLQRKLEAYEAEEYD